MMKRILAIMLAAVLAGLLFAGAACADDKAAEEQPRVILYLVFKPRTAGGNIAVFCIDEGGTLWGTAPADLEPGFSEEDVVRLMQERRGMTKMENMIYKVYDDHHMKKEWFEELAQRADIVPAAEGTPEETGAKLGEYGIYALRNDADGNPESVLLGMCGRKLFENPDPEAQYLFMFMWRKLREHSNTFHPPFDYATEGIAPYGFRMASVREFFGLENVDGETAVITAGTDDCMTGRQEADAPLEGENREKILAMLDRGVIIRKENPWIVTGGTVCYTFSDAAGEYLGEIVTYDQDKLAVAGDGMYRISLLPESTENLPEEELKLLRIKIGGIEYQLGKSTPRDLIHDGWRCVIIDDGTFRFENGDVHQSFYADTANGGLDEPICRFFLSTTVSLPVEYCGFDSCDDPENPEDPDTVWRNKAADALGPEDFQGLFSWGGLEYWLRTSGLGEFWDDTWEESSDYDVEITLSDGRQLRIGGNPSFAPSIVLKEKEALKAEAEDE